MEGRSVLSYNTLISIFLIVVSIHPHFVNTYQKKINHQQQISVDYFGQPVIDGEDFEAAKLLPVKVKRRPESVTEPNSIPTTEQTSSSSAVTTSPLPSSLSTSMESDDNVTYTSPSGSPQTPTSASTDVTSSSTTPEVTTPPPSTTTTTEEPPLPFLTGEGHTTKGYFCLCDYQVRVCDMNCCCDKDCSDEERRLFKRCDDYSMIYDPHNQHNERHNCFKSYVFYKENVPYRIDRTDKSLFCVVKENVRQAKEFSRADMSRISNRISHGKIDTRPKYTWDSLNKETASVINDKNPYKYGSAIWSQRSETENGEEVKSQEVMLRLPAPFHTDMCSILEPVKYLQDSLYRCVRPLHSIITQCTTLRELDANYFIKNLAVIVNPTKTVENSSEYVVSHITPAKWCSRTLNDCTELSLEMYSNDGTGSGEDVEFPLPELGGILISDKCTNVLAKLNLTFFHEGIQGITKILAKALLIDVPLGQTEIVQEFRTEFIWSNAASSKVNDDATRNDTNNATSMEDLLHLSKLPRSGNPGYIVGKPLILGKKVMKLVHTNDSDGKPQYVEKMHVLPDIAKWLHIQSAGACPLSHKAIRDQPRHPILFGYDHVSTCNLPLEHFHYCEELQRHIASVIFGLTGEVNPKQYTMLPLYVAAYGSPDAFPSDWVRLTFVDISTLTQESAQFLSVSSAGSDTISSGCNGIATAVHITVSYAYVGPVDAPQAKVTGIFYELEEPISIPDSAEERRVKNIPVTTTVSFLDVTGKPTTRVATFPVLSIRLPTDFFYPFSTSTTGPSSAATKRAASEYFSLSSSLAFLLLICGTFVL